MAGRKRPGLWVMEGSWSASVRDPRSVNPVLAATQDGRRAHHINDPDDLARTLRQ